MANTLQAAGAKNRALLGSNLSVDSGAKTSWGSVKAEPQRNLMTGIGMNAINPRGLGTEFPENVLLFHRLGSSAPLILDSVLSSEACLRLQLLHEPIPLTGCRNHYSASWASPIAALTRALTKELVAAAPAARDKPPAW